MNFCIDLFEEDVRTEDALN